MKILNLIKRLLCGCCEEKENINRAKNNFERAPEPTDVYWDNLNVTL